MVNAWTIVIVAAGFVTFVASQLDFFDGDDEAFRKYLEKLHKQIDVHDSRRIPVQVKVQSDINKILKQVKEMDPCFDFNLQMKGSSFEGVKIGDPDEFDFGLLNEKWTGKIVLETKDDTRVGFGFAVEKQETCLHKYLLKSTKKVDPGVVRGRLRELVHDAMTKLKMGGKIRRDPWVGGPAVTFEFLTENEGYPEISIDLAIGIDLLVWPKKARELSSTIKKVGAQLVPKVNSQPNTDLWQISFSQVERKIMTDIDRDGGCRKKVLQLAKHFKTRSIGQWFSLASYHLKTVLFHLNVELKKPGDWAQDKLVPRFKDVIERLLHHLTLGKLPSFFMAGYDVFDGKPDLKSAIRSVREFVDRLYSYPNSFLPENNSKKPVQAKFNDDQLKNPVYVFNI